MSISEIQRFRADLKSDAALRAEAETYGAARAASPDDVIAFAAAKGYKFDATELAEVANEARGREISDAELDIVSGGGEAGGGSALPDGNTVWLSYFCAALMAWPYLQNRPQKET